ncbi:MAG: hypothetical protein H7836_01700 [Magnetococcus sp. YQC-3]
MVDLETIFRDLDRRCNLVNRDEFVIDCLKDWESGKSFTDIELAAGWYTGGRSDGKAPLYSGKDLRDAKKMAKRIIEARTLELNLPGRNPDHEVLSSLGDYDNDTGKEKVHFALFVEWCLERGFIPHHGIEEEWSGGGCPLRKGTELRAGILRNKKILASSCSLKKKNQAKADLADCEARLAELEGGTVADALQGEPTATPATPELPGTGTAGTESTPTKTPPGKRTAERNKLLQTEAEQVAADLLKAGKTFNKETVSGKLVETHEDMTPERIARIIRVTWKHPPGET